MWKCEIISFYSAYYVKIIIFAGVKNDFTYG